MAANLADDIFECIFLHENDSIAIQLFPSVLFKPVLFQVMAWCRTGDKPLAEPIMTQFIEAYMRH